jgi:DNA-binding SARP family transcriptional activator
MQDILTIHTLGMFSVTIGDVIISDSSARSQKVWKIFKYLITNRHKMVPVETLIKVIWPEEGPDNPLKSLYTLIARLRRLLNDSGADGLYILFQHDSYQWNSKLPVFLDVAEFEQLISSARGTQEEQDKKDLLKKAVDMYIGDYLSESAYEAWAQPVTNYYKRLYLTAVIELANIYARSSAHDEIIWLCSRAIENEPYEESLYERLIQTLLISGKIAEAQKHYRYYADLMQKEFGAQPSEELRALYLEMQNTDGEELDLSSIQRRLDGGNTQSGVFFCTSDIFNQIYQLDRRADERMKFPVFLGLATIVFENDDTPGAKSLKNVMFMLRQCLMRTLRKGDIVSQYSKNQYLLMLSAYRPEDAQAAMTRVQRVFETERVQLKDSAGMTCKLEMTFSQIGSPSVT